MSYGSIGTCLLKLCEETALSKGAKLLSLGVVAGNPAERLYKRFGFEDAPKEDGFDSGKICACIFCVLGCHHRQMGGKVMHNKPLTEIMER